MIERKIKLFAVAVVLLSLAGASYAQTLYELIREEVWNLTLLDATTNAPLRREWAGYVTLNTADGTIGLANVEPAEDWAQPNANASMRLPIRPNDIPENPNPTESAIYVIAWFHTHTPTTFVTFSYREVGPSSADYAASIHPYINMPGFAYDYIAAPATNHPANTIPKGHPLNADTQLYLITPPERRPTP